MVQLVQPAQHGFFNHDAEPADQQRRRDQHHPVIDAPIIQAHPRQERAHHVQRAMRKIDHVEQAEDDRQAERQHRVERAVDQAQQQLAEHRLQGNAEYFHGCIR